MDPASLIQLAQQVTLILAPVLPFIYTGGKAVVNKTGDMLLEKGIEKVGSVGWKRANILMKKISPKMTASLEKAFTNTSKNSEDPKAKEELQQEILKLLKENPAFAEEIKFTVNLNVENIDQLAVGNYNNFFNFETPSNGEYIKIIEYLDQKRKDRINQEILSHYNTSVLPYYSERLKKFVTENRADELEKALTYLENHRILFISGVGGVGKSTLARALLDFRPVNVPEPFWFSFNQNQDAKLGDILEKLAAYMNVLEIASFKDERREAGELDVDKLTGELQKRSEVWLIFDDLSTILEDQQFADRGIERLFSSLRYNTHNAKIIITSRILPIFENGESLINTVEDEKKQVINGLKIDFATDYLVKNGLERVEPEKLKKLATGVDGHLLALKLLVELVKEYGAAAILKDLSRYQEEKEDTILKARKLFDKLAGEEKDLLENISVYREPVGIDGIEEMLTRNVSRKAIKKLIDKSLLETDHNGRYWLHPLVQEFLYKDLKDKKYAHVHAIKYYFSIPLPRNPIKKEDLQSAIEAHYHACEAREYDLAADIIQIYNLPYLLNLWGYSRKLIEIYEKLLPESHLKYQPVLKDKHTCGVILGNLGVAYGNIGELKKAIEYNEQALKIFIEIGEKQKEGNTLESLGIAYSDLEELKKAVEYHEQALEISKKFNYRRGEGTSLGNLGNAYIRLGNPRKAIECYKKALKISRDIGDRYAEGNHLGNLGVAYGNIGELKKAIEYYEQALKIDIEIENRRGKWDRLKNLGLAYNDMGEPRKAIKYHEQALKISREI